MSDIENRASETLSRLRRSREEAQGYGVAAENRSRDTADIMEMFIPVFRVVDVLHRENVHIPGVRAIPVRVPAATVLRAKVQACLDKGTLPSLEIDLDRNTQLQVYLTSAMKPYTWWCRTVGCNGDRTDDYQPQSAQQLADWLTTKIAEFEVQHNPHNLYAYRRDMDARERLQDSPNPPAQQAPGNRPLRVIDLGDNEQLNEG